MSSENKNDNSVPHSGTSTESYLSDLSYEEDLKTRAIMEELVSTLNKSKDDQDENEDNAVLGLALDVNKIDISYLPAVDRKLFLANLSKNKTLLKETYYDNYNNLAAKLFNKPIRSIRGIPDISHITLDNMNTFIDVGVKAETERAYLLLDFMLDKALPKALESFGYNHFLALLANTPRLATKYSQTFRESKDSWEKIKLILETISLEVTKELNGLIKKGAYSSEFYKEMGRCCNLLVSEYKIAFSSDSVQEVLSHFDIIPNKNLIYTLIDVSRIMYMCLQILFIKYHGNESAISSGTYEKFRDLFLTCFKADTTAVTRRLLGASNSD